MTRECCICQENTYNAKYIFCTKCYREWAIPCKDEPWLKFLVNDAQSTYRKDTKAMNNLSLDQIEYE